MRDFELSSSALISTFFMATVKLKETYEMHIGDDDVFVSWGSRCTARSPPPSVTLVKRSSAIIFDRNLGGLVGWVEGGWSASILEHIILHGCIVKHHGTHLLTFG